MIKLTSLLREVLNKPKAIFLAGPAGSGKTFISKQFIPDTFRTLNIDDTYEKLLKKSGLGMNTKDFSPEELSKSAQLMSLARKATDENYANLINDKKNIVIDGTGGASKPLLKKKQELEDLGYETFMIALYVSPITSLERNISRERSLMPSIVVRTWRDYMKNIEDYKAAFGNNFVLINNDPQNANKTYNPEEIKQKYFDTALAKGKEKTPEEKAKSEEKNRELNQDIQQLLTIEREFDSLDIAKTKINSFIK